MIPSLGELAERRRETAADPVRESRIVLDVILSGQVALEVRGIVLDQNRPYGLLDHRGGRGQSIGVPIDCCKTLDLSVAVGGLIGPRLAVAPVLGDRSVHDAPKGKRDPCRWTVGTRDSRVSDHKVAHCEDAMNVAEPNVCLVARSPARGPRRLPTPQRIEHQRHRRRVPTCRVWTSLSYPSKIRSRTTRAASVAFD